MKNRVFVYDKSQNLISKYIEKMEKFLLLRGLFDFSFLTSTDFEEFQESLNGKRENGSTFVIICDNDKLDKALETIKTDDDKLTLVDEQAIKLENETSGEKMIFVPFELNFESFLNDFLPEKEVFVCSIFGKSRKFVDDKFSELKNREELNYEIITKHRYLHIVYSSGVIADDCLERDFGESVFSKDVLRFGEDEKTLQHVINDILTVNKKRLTVVEHSKNGRLFSNLDCDGLVARDAEDFKKFGVSQEVMDGDNFGKEATYILSKFALEDTKCDFVLTVCDGMGFDEKTYISVGDKDVVHLYSSVFEENDDRVEILSDFALFRLLCFLKKHKFESAIVE